MKIEHVRDFCRLILIHSHMNQVEIGRRSLQQRPLSGIFCLWVRMRGLRQDENIGEMRRVFLAFCPINFEWCLSSQVCMFHIIVIL